MLITDGFYGKIFSDKPDVLLIFEAKLALSMLSSIFYYISTESVLMLFRPTLFV